MPYAPAQRAQITDTFARGFQNDPSLCWILRDPEDRANRLPRLFDWLFDDHEKHGLILTSPNLEAVTFWRSPGKVHHHDAQTPQSLWRLANVFGLSLPRAARLGRAIDLHVPSGEDFLYLRYAAVKPERQGKGWGGSVIRAGIEHARHLGVRVCLETAKRDNVAIYQRLGFGVVSEWAVPGGGPHFWTMVAQRP